jgi:hypothetical protein
MSVCERKPFVTIAAREEKILACPTTGKMHFVFWPENKIEYIQPVKTGDMIFVSVTSANFVKIVQINYRQF